jgi:hypothetical protein
VRFRIALTDRLEHANPPDPLALLGARSERPRRCCAAEQGDELAPPDLRDHSITSSARASSIGLCR